LAIINTYHGFSGPGYKVVVMYNFVIN